MNPLTLVKRIQKINTKEADLGISDDASWHAKYRSSAYVFVGGVPYDLTEGDLLAVFSQYGEIVDVNLVRDKATGKSKGFAFIAYEDQRSTNLAVDNLNGAQILGRIVRVDHVSDYKKKIEEDEETERKKREERGVCRAFQRGQCNYGDSCKFSHNEQRAANTGWGAEEDKIAKWRHDKSDDLTMCNKGFVGKRGGSRRTGKPDSTGAERYRANDRHVRSFRGRDTAEDYHRHGETDSMDQKGRESGRKGEDFDGTSDRRLFRRDSESNSREDQDRREEKRSRRHAVDYDRRDYRDKREDRERETRREREKRSSYASDSLSKHHREGDKDDYCRSRR